MHGRLVAAAVAGVAGDALDLDVRQPGEALGDGDGARGRALAGAVQAHVELDQQRRPRAVAPERGRQPLGGGDAVDGDRQLDAVGGDARQPVALLGAERRVVHEDARRAGLVEDLRLAGLGDGQAAGAELDLAHADLGRLVRLGVRPELDAVLVGVRLQAAQVGVQAVEVDDGDGRLDVRQGPADLLVQEAERALGPGADVARSLLHTRGTLEPEEGA